MSDLSLRPFGLQACDLNIDFQQTPRPHLVTQILACCAGIPDEGAAEASHIWGLTVGKRIEYLLKLADQMGVGELRAQFECANESCEETIEIELAVDELLHQVFRANQVDQFQITIAGEALSFRKPTGRDQRAWLQKSYADEPQATRAILDSLLTTPEKTPALDALLDENITAIEQAFRELDPLVGYQLTIHCPYCESDLAYEIELQELLLNTLQSAQSGLFREIHQLALHYHWDEGQILSLAPWRRARYLSFLANEKPSCVPISAD
jgi:hypothetical protein